MEEMVGRQPFEEFLHDYVQYYKGQLVTSEVNTIIFQEISYGFYH